MFFEIKTSIIYSVQVMIYNGTHDTLLYIIITHIGSDV